MQLLIIILLGLLGILQYQLWLGAGSYPEHQQLQQLLQQQQLENQQLQNRNALLAIEIADLKQGTAVIEALAREELGMIKPGEIFFQIIEP